MFLLRISLSGVREGHKMSERNNIDVLFKYPRSSGMQTTECNANSE